MPRHNLPASRSSFVGREQEILQLKQALATTRLVTLTGTGGSGKTRLALEVAGDLLQGYPQGAWLVELAPLSEETLVPKTVAGALGVPERPQEPLTETLTDVLRDREILLILDNCEHLVYAVAEFVDVLLDWCPRLRILATTREALGVEGEVIWQVPPLSMPNPELSPTLERLESAESTRLFLARARNRDRSFALASGDAQAVAEICRKLEGMPLAIELAAARVGTLSPAQIAERLEGSLELLGRGPRTAVSRQRTLRGALDWSHDLLFEPETALFRRLSVFADGWDMEASETVASGEGVEVSEVVELISGLVEKSLVVAEQGGERYRMLEPVRQYAFEKLEQSGEADDSKRAHARYFLALAEEAKTGYPGPEEGRWLSRLEMEHDNLRAALSWSLEDGSPKPGLRLAGALVWFWEARAHYSEGANWLGAALSKEGEDASHARAKVLWGLGRILRMLGDLERAEAFLAGAVNLYQELEDRGQIAECLASLGWVVQEQGEAVRATSLFERSLEVGRGTANKKYRPTSLTGLAWIAAENGDFERAHRLWEEALTLVRELGSVFDTCTGLFILGYMELARGDREHAAALFEEAMTLSHEVGNRYIAANCLLGLGLVETLRGEPARGEALVRDSLARRIEMGTKMDLAENLEGLAEASEALGVPRRAARLWGAATALREITDQSWTPVERLLHEPLLIATRSRRDEATWEEAFEEGRAMSMEAAIEYALSEEEPSTANSMAEQLPGSSPATEHPAGLTSREAEVLRLVAGGMTSARVAEELFLSPRTVSTHLTSVYRKLGVGSRAAAIRFALEHDLA